MKKENLRLVVVGHVDHGKSTLIGRILLDTHSLPQDKLKELDRISKELGKDIELAFLVDQLKEERQQDKTIDTTQTFFKTAQRSYCLIDSPGHTEFIKNMITAASCAQAALLVVAADEGLQEQTQRHAYLIKMLGIDAVIVVFNKMDAVNYDEGRFEVLKEEIESFFVKLGIKILFCIPVSAKYGINISAKAKHMPWYKAPHLLKVLDSIDPQEDFQDRPLRFSVQDVYENGKRKIVVGRVESGNIAQGDTVTVLPAQTKVKISEVLFFKERFKSRANAGENPGLILDDPSSIKRGDILVSDSPKLSNAFKSNIFWLSDEPLDTFTQFTLRCATQQTKGQAQMIEQRMNSATLDIIEEKATKLGNNEAATVIFKIQNPLFFEKFSFIESLGRFIIEDKHVIKGVGIITQPVL